MTRPLLPERAVESFLAQIEKDLAEFFLDEHGYCAPYRWARSGLSGVRARSRVDRSQGHMVVYAENEDGGQESVPVTPVELHALRGEAARVARAAGLIRSAMQQLAAARTILTPKDRKAGPVEVGQRLSKAERVRKDEWLAAMGNQYERQSRGTGYGEA